MSDLIELRLFGYPELRLHGQPITPALPHKALALLAYLALAAQPVGRETLATLLWPDAPTQTAKHSLRNLLSLLRKGVGDGIESNHRTIHLSTAQFQHIDVVAFEQGVSAFKKNQPGERPDFTRWQATLDLYRGDFLEGFYIQQSETFEEWTVLRREYLRQQLLAQLLALSEAYTAANTAPDMALACLDRIFAIAPEYEAAYRLKIQLLFALGRRTEALQYYERYQQLFAIEPDITPRPVSGTLYQPIPIRGTSEPVAHSQPPPAEASVSTPLIHNGGTATKPTGLNSLLTSPLGTLDRNSVAMDRQTDSAPPPLSPATPPAPQASALPPQITTFVGRQTELSEIAAHLQDPACRLLTLLGPGGIGKSRLALAVAESQQPTFTHGVTYASLANIRPDEFNARINPLLATIAEALAQPLTGRTAPVQQLVAYLAPQHRLLVIDNLEHMLDTVEPLSELLAGAPGLKVLITSRARLNLQEEWIYTVGGLTYPLLDQRHLGAPPVTTSNPPEPTVYSAPALFAQRARQVQANFDLTAVYPAVVRICQLVEGMPLALELAATWVRQMPCEAIVSEIERGIDLLTTNVRNVSVRHRSMRAVFDHTWSLLSMQEQQLLAKLAVFRGGFTREAAMQVANASLWLLAGLVDKSLLTVDTHGRYAIHELLRQYMTEQLIQQSASYERVYEQHCHYYLTLLAQQERLWQGHDSQRASTTIQAEIDNIRAAWHYAVESQFFVWLGPTIYTVWWFFELHGWLLEAQELLGRAIAAVEQFLTTQALPPTAPEKLLLGQLKTGRGWFQNRQGLPEQGQLTLQEGVALLQGAGGADQRPLAFGLMLLGSVHQVLGQYPQACPMLEESVRLAHVMGDTWCCAGSLMTLGQILLLMGRYADAEAASQQALHLCQQIGSQHPLIYILSNLGRASQIQGNYDLALQEHTHCLIERQRLGDRVGIVYTLTDLGHAARMLGDRSRAQQFYQQALQEAQQLRHRDGEARAAWGLGALAEMEGDLPTAQRWFEHSETALPHVVLGYTLPTRGWVEIGLGNLPAARAFWHRVLQQALANERLPVVLDALAAFAWLQAQAGDQAMALQWLALVEHHPASTHETRLRVQRLQESLAATIAPILATEAQAQGQQLAQDPSPALLRQVAAQVDTAP